MSPIQEAGLTCVREMRRNLRSAKGLVMAVLFLLGGGAASLIYAALSSFTDRLREGRNITDDMMRQVRAEFWQQVWNADVGNYLADAPWIYVGLYKGVLWFIPLLTLLVGFDQIAGDLQHRTIRYTAVRARRGSIVAGKALGIWSVVSVLLLVLHLFVWLVALLQGSATFVQTLSWGPRLFGLTLFFVAAYAGLTVLVSSLTRRPVLALFMGLIAFFGLSIGDLAVDAIKSLELPDYEWVGSLGYLFPDYYEQWLVTPRAAELVGGMAVLLGWAAGSTALAAWVLNKRDV